MKQPIQQLAKIESDYRTAVANYQSVLNQIEEKKNDLIHIEIDIEKIESESEIIHETKNSLEEEVAGLREARIQLTQLKERLNRQSKIADELRGKKSQMEKLVIEHGASLATNQAVFEHTLNAIPEDLRELSVLERRIAELNRQKK